MRPYHLALPADYDGTRPTPLILNWHGSGSGLTQQVVYSALPAEGAARGFIVVTPDGTGEPRGWNLLRLPSRADDYGFAEDLLAELEQRLCVDPNRVFSAGISAGAAFSALLACTPPYRIAAVGLVATTLGPACPPRQQVSVVSFHGTADEVVPYAGGTVNALASAGRSVAPVEDAAARWAAHDGCETAPQRSPVGTDVEHVVYPGCDPGLAVELYRVEGGGHTWPGAPDVRQFTSGLGATTDQVEATDVMLDFFAAHPRPAG